MANESCFSKTRDCRHSIISVFVFVEALKLWGRIDWVRPLQWVMHVTCFPILLSFPATSFLSYYSSLPLVFLSYYLSLPLVSYPTITFSDSSQLATVSAWFLLLNVNKNLTPGKILNMFLLVTCSSNVSVMVFLLSISKTFSNLKNVAVCLVYSWTYF